MWRALTTQAKDIVLVRCETGAELQGHGGHVHENDTIWASFITIPLFADSEWSTIRFTDSLFADPLYSKSEQSSRCHKKPEKSNQYTTSDKKKQSKSILTGKEVIAHVPS